jgi:hypothetical protein
MSRADDVRTCVRGASQAGRSGRGSPFADLAVTWRPMSRSVTGARVLQDQQRPQRAPRPSDRLAASKHISPAPPPLALQQAKGPGRPGQVEVEQFASQRRDDRDPE